MNAKNDEDIDMTMNMNTKDTSGRAGFSSAKITPTPFGFNKRRGQYFDLEAALKSAPFTLDPQLREAFERINVLYRALCAILYNFVPKSGHPGGSISSGHIAQSLIFHTMDYDFSNPDDPASDHLCYAAGHKAMGLYAAWALRNECVRVARPDLLPDEKYQLRLEDLLGFRRNPVTEAPLFKKYRAKSLDGHPTPVTPFVRLATGASGVGVAAAVGHAFGILDTYGARAPAVHIIEGEGGMTPGRVHEVMGAAGSNQIKNVIMHVDWNQASIDSNNVCREKDEPGEYVQWNPCELAYLHDWNVIYVHQGMNFEHALAAQQLAVRGIQNNQPTAIVYRTRKGWKYGIEGCKSHGAGHDFCSPEFYQSLSECEDAWRAKFPKFEGEKSEAAIEANFFECLMGMRGALESDKQVATLLAEGVGFARERARGKKLSPRDGAPESRKIYESAELTPETTPAELRVKPGDNVTHRGVLAGVLNYLNYASGGAVIGSAADLFGSTNLADLGMDKSKGYYNFSANPNSRLIMIGGICEDAIGGFMSGLSSFGRHIGVGSSYGAFIAALQHISARLHAIGQESRVHSFGDKRNPFVIICGHAGPRTGEDGPTHADPQSLQLLQENFPDGAVVTLTPWDTQEIWPLMAATLKSRPAVIAPFVTRPSEKAVDRAALRLPPASAAAKGVYALREAAGGAGGSTGTGGAGGSTHGTLVLQGNGVTYEFVSKVLPVLDKEGINLNIYYVASAELFDLLSDDEKLAIFPPARASEAMGITEFTLPTMYRWVTSSEGRARILHPFAKKHFLGSGQADKVFMEAGLDGASQLAAIRAYIKR